MNLKQELFVEEYLRNGGNATRAAIKAGYSKESARSIGQENLTKPDIKEAIEQRRQQIREQYAATAERVIRELSSIAFASIYNIMECEGDEVKLRPFTELSGEELAAIAEIVEQDTKEGKKRSVKMHPKIQALKLLGDHFGLFYSLQEIIDRMTPEQLQQLRDQLIQKLQQDEKQNAR